MPRPKDPVWENFDSEANPGKADWAKCKLCSWKHVGIPERLRNHYASHFTSESRGEKESRQYVTRSTLNDTSEDVGDIRLQDKVTQLEETLKKFRAEVDMKMTIVEQVLTTRNELFSVQKKLLDREHALHETVLSHWKNISELAASGLSLTFSANAHEGDGEEDGNDDLSKSPLLGKRQALRATLARRERRKRLKMRRGGSDSERESGEDEDDDFAPPESDPFEDESTAPEGSVPVGLEKKVFVKFYSEEDAQPGERVTRTPVWKYYLREENGDSALCKLCDEEGVQSILKVRDCSTSSLHTHLKFKHKITVEQVARKEHNSDSGDGTAAISGGEDDLAPPKPPRSRSGTGVIGRPQSQVWSYFTEFILDGQRKQQCLACGHLVSAQAPRLIRHHEQCKNRQKETATTHQPHSAEVEAKTEENATLTQNDVMLL